MPTLAAVIIATRVLWTGTEEIAGSSVVLNRLRSDGKKNFFVTNNPSKTREQVVQKARALGFHIFKEEVLSTAYLVARYLKSVNFSKKVYLIGVGAIAAELDDVGIPHFGIGPDPFTPDYLKQLTENHLELDPDVGAVIVGTDEHFSYLKLTKAMAYLHDPNVMFIGTNIEEFYLLPNGVKLPAAGPILRCIESCSQRSAFVVGKPNDYIETVLDEYNIIKEKTLMIGDRCDTDIEFGNRCGFRTLLVLTGVTSIKDITERQIECSPDFIIPKLGDLSTFFS